MSIALPFLARPYEVPSMVTSHQPVISKKSCALFWIGSTGAVPGPGSAVVPASGGWVVTPLCCPWPTRPGSLDLRLFEATATPASGTAVLGVLGFGLTGPGPGPGPGSV